MRFRTLVTVVGAGFGMAWGPSGVSGQSRPMPKVVIVTTGGTIASRAGAPIMEGPALVQAVPELLDHADVSVEEFSRIGSSQMTPPHWLRLAKRINALFGEQPDLAGVVVTHGTDTLEETAYFLHLTIRDSRPVVMVGSMRSATEISADGPANLLNAVRVVVSPEAGGKGVLVVLNEEISSARDVWKTDNRRVQTFRTPELGFLGFADPDTVVFYRAPLRRHTAHSAFDVIQLTELPRVEIVADYAGFDGSAIDYWMEKRISGLVVTTFAVGRMSAGARRALREASRRSTALAIASRVPGGRITGNPLDDDVRAVIARDLPAHKARVLLMLALTRTQEVREIQRMFDSY